MKLTLYFTLGYPDNETLAAFLHEVPKNGIERIELGFPCNNPRYDGPIIKNTHESALRTYSDEVTKEMVTNLSSNSIEVYALVYLQSVYEKTDEFAQKIASFGFSGIILPDLLIDYFSMAGEIIEKFKRHGVEIIPFVTPSTPDAVIKYIASETGQWVYYGILPSTGINVPVAIDRMYRRARETTGAGEICFGFGLREVSQIIELKKLGADGIAIGSRLVEFLGSRNVHGFNEFLEEINVARS